MEDEQGSIPYSFKAGKGLFSFPAMSTPSEWLFSAAGYISNQRRSCLNGEHIHLISVFKQKHVTGKPRTLNKLIVNKLLGENLYCVIPIDYCQYCINID